MKRALLSTTIRSGPSRRRRESGVTVLVVIILLFCVVALSSANLVLLRVLKGRMDLIAKKQRARLASIAAVPASRQNHSPKPPARPAEGER